MNLYVHRYVHVCMIYLYIYIVYIYILYSIYIYIHIDMYMYVYIYEDILSLSETIKRAICVCRHVYVYVCIYVCMHTSMFLPMPKVQSVYADMCMCMLCMHTSMLCMHKYSFHLTTTQINYFMYVMYALLNDISPEHT